MNEIEIRVVDLIEKHLNGELSDAEKQELETWKNQSESNRRIVHHLTDNSHLKHSISDSYPDERKNRVLASIHSMIEADQGAVAKVRMMTIRKLMSAAAIIGLIACIAYFTLYVHKPQRVAETKIPSGITDHAPGRDGAILKLSNGQEIVLDNAANGALAQQGNAAIAKREGNVLVYSNNGKSEGEVLHNTLSTQVGRQFQVVLPDGSRVWLNSESSITYPTTFTGDVRKVEITGEAYFEVAPSIALLSNGQKGKRPFVVSANGMEIEVLGTHFNVNSYADEPAMKTTLLEGKVKVRSTTTNEQTTLAPGEQAILRQAQDDKTKLDKTKEVDVDAEVAWRFGYFQFKRTDLNAVMRQLERWYDVQVEYSGGVPDRKFSGSIPRTLNLSNVLTLLQNQDVHFSIEGKKIIVTP